ncbi:MAG: polysaccharide biosynthesis C-terminal domain-containing protein, partial [Clostridia bacterium]|nr:polysaccharide biosynthesis C-terminal domain-containing protein [Clostridia bacterium]
VRESNSKLVRIIISTAIPIVLGAAMVYLANLIDVSFIKRRLVASGFGDETLRNTIYGIFSTQYHKTTNIVLGIAATLPATILPGISQVAAKKDKALLERKMKNSVRASFLITMPCCAGLAILSNPIIYLLFPRNRVSPAGVADPHILIIAGVWSIIIVSIVQVLTSILQGNGDFKTAPINMTIGLAVKLALNYVLISTKLNIMGAIVSTYVCYFIVLVLDYIAVVKRTGIKLNLPKLAINPALACAAMSAIVFGIMYGGRALLYAVGYYRYISNAVLAGICVAAGGICYFIFALKFKAIDKGDLSTVPIIGGFLKKPFMTRFVNKLVK